MGPKTPNNSYNVPKDGAADWDDPLNDNFQQLDTDVEIRDTDANKSNYEPKDDALYRATDTGAVYLGDGSSWNLVDIEVSALTASSVNINPTNTYSPSNDVADRTFDANATTVDELADVVATLIRDLGLDS